MEGELKWRPLGERPEEYPCYVLIIGTARGNKWGKIYHAPSEAEFNNIVDCWQHWFTDWAVVRLPSEVKP